MSNETCYFKSEGADSYRNGGPACPYFPGMWEYELWQEGYSEAYDEDHK